MKEEKKQYFIETHKLRIVFFFCFFFKAVMRYDTESIKMHDALRTS